MTAVALTRLALGYGWKPKGWHLALAEHIPPMAVIGIFRHAVVTKDKARGVLTVAFHNPELVERAAAFKPYLRMVLGPVEIEGPRYAQPMKAPHATPNAAAARLKAWREKHSGEERHDG